jgi:RNA polymerase sigma-70 factor (ECF subfamily)
VDVLAKGDAAAVAAMLHADVVLVSDGGGRVVTPLHPLWGSSAVARVVSALVTADAVLTVEHVNGQPGVVVRVLGRPRAVMAVTFGESVVTRVWLVVNPDKLERWHTAG